MKIFAALCLLLVLACRSSLFAQTSSGREGKLKTISPDGTSGSKDDFLRATEYLFTHPADAGEAARKQKLSFVTAWLVNSPDVSLELNANMIRYFEKDEAGLMIMYMAAWGRYALETGDTSAVNGNIKGMRAVLAYYKDRANHVKRLKSLDQLLKKEEEGRLDAYLTEQFRDVGEK